MPLIASHTSPVRFAWSGKLIFGSLVVSLLLFVLVRGELVASNQPLEIARAQFAVFPVAMLAMYVIIRAWLPRAWILVLVASCLALGSTIVAVGTRYGNTPTVLVSLLGGDSYGSQSKITRDIFVRASERFGTIRFSPLFEQPRPEKLPQLFSDAPHIRAVVLGNLRWITIYFDVSRRSASIPREWAGEYHGLNLVTQVDQVGLSYQPIEQTATFVAAIASGEEDFIRYGAELNAPWTTHAHRAYASFILGNRLLDRAFQEGAYQYLDCAIDAYSDGVTRVTSRDNHELRSALLNNLGVARFVLGHREHSRSLKTQGYAQIVAATRKPKKLQGLGRSYYAPRVAQENISVIREVRFSRASARGKRGK